LEPAEATEKNLEELPRFSTWDGRTMKRRGGVRVTSVKLTLELRLTGQSPWHREVDRPYQCVPRVGEWMAMDDDGVVMHDVKRIEHRNDGAVRLSFGPFEDDRDNDTDFKTHLRDIGFGPVRLRD
jgi:hypothetical protein